MNKAQIIGRLGQDPEVRYMPSGGAVANLSVATSQKWKDKDTGERQERTEWHRVTVFGKLAEIVGEYLKKGSQVYFEGRLQTRKWQDKDGGDRYTTEIIADQMEMLGSRGDGERPAGGQPNQAQRTPAPTPPQGGGEEFNDDIPF